MEKIESQIVNLINKFNEAIYQKRLFILMIFMMIFGIIIYSILSFEPSWFIVILAGLILLSLLVWQMIKGNLNVSSILIFSIWVGFILLPIHAQIFGTQMLKYPSFGTYQVKVIKVLSLRDDGQRIIVSNINALESSRDLPIRSARLFIRKGPLLEAGDIIEGKMRFAPVPSPVTVGGYDSQFQSYFVGIGAFASTTNAPKIITKQSDFSFKAFIDQSRFNIGKRISSVLQDPAKGIALALIVGDQSNIKDEVRTKMATAGLAHMLAISGLHLSLVAGGVFAFVRIALSLSYSFTQRFAVKKISAIVGILAALIYLGLSGASVSAVRATIMLILIFGAVIVGRKALTMRNVAFAALFVIILDPSAIFLPSFQLSFAAVVALIATYEVLRQKVSNRLGFASSVLQFFLALASTSIIAGLATAIFAAFHFQQIAPLGVLGNLAALPILTFFVLPAAFIAVLLMPLGLEAPLLNVMGWAINLILNIAQRVANLSEGLGVNFILLPISLIIGLVAFAWFAFFIGKLKFLGPILALPLIFIFALDRQPDVLVSASTKAVAIRGNDLGNKEYGLGLIAGRLNSFTTNAWQDTYQEKIAAKLDGALCDEIACFYNSPAGFAISLIKQTRRAFIEDCAIADLVITRLKAPNYCKEITQVIDIENIRNEGTQWLYWNEKQQGFTIRPAISSNNRPWRLGYY